MSLWITRRSHSMEDIGFSYSAYATPSCIALLLKIIFLFKVDIDSPLSRALLVFCLLLTIQNSLEAVGYFYLARDIHIAEHLVHGYMLVCYALPSALVYFIAKLADKNFTYLHYLLILFSVLLAALHQRGLLVSHYTNNGYALVVVPASLYFLFEIFAIVGSIFSVFMLFQATRKSSDNAIIARCKLGLFAIFPFCFLTILIIVLMRFTENAGPAIIMPIASSAFLLVTMLASKGSAYDISFIVLRFSKVFCSYLIKCAKNNTTSLSDQITLFEKSWIEVALQEAKGSQRNAAKLLGMHESTLSRKITKLGIST